ncbi:hypothetical protein N6H18_00580 [Reichenbachiella agarivorans]|uniref:Uncharacterized protein n=1 Tax=Reichenbachiella agarivorans TaxID=2979464 RepID=A0ABY6CR07_9BACT|nr:hypothetical protein [Reichenbachiella agarivorans]UXP32470.1 hypothetical protein N6H18_00580 [Reichenbachiella agarivorans]
MSTHLELRSTYLYSDGLGSITTQKNNIYSKPTSTSLSQESEIPFKNKFAVATYISKVIHQGLGMELDAMTSAYSSKKLASQINSSLDNSNKLSLNQIAEDLVGFDLNENTSFDSSVRTKLCIKPGAHKGHAILHIPSFVPENDLEVPEGATNFKISASLISLSDFQRKSEIFEMISPSTDSKFGHYQTPMLPILKISTQPMTSQLRLMECGLISYNTATVLVLAVKFYQYKDKRFIPMVDQAVISIRRVF